VAKHSISLAPWGKGCRSSGRIGMIQPKSCLVSCEGTRSTTLPLSTHEDVATFMARIGQQLAKELASRLDKEKDLERSKVKLLQETGGFEFRFASGAFSKQRHIDSKLENTCLVLWDIERLVPGCSKPCCPCCKGPSPRASLRARASWSRRALPLDSEASSTGLCRVSGAARPSRLPLVSGRPISMLDLLRDLCLHA